MQLNTSLLLVFVFNITFGQQTLQTINKDQIKSKWGSSLQQNEKKIVHFWATWCAPCIKELQEIDKHHTQLKDIEKVDFISLDYIRDSSKVSRFIKSKPWMQQVYILSVNNDVDWIEFFSEKWQGNIPCTIVIEGENKKAIFDKSLQLEEWLNILK